MPKSNTQNKKKFSGFNSILPIWFFFLFTSSLFISSLLFFSSFPCIVGCLLRDSNPRREQTTFASRCCIVKFLFACVVTLISRRRERGEAATRNLCDHCVSWILDNIGSRMHPKSRLYPLKVTKIWAQVAISDVSPRAEVQRSYGVPVTFFINFRGSQAVAQRTSRPIRPRLPLRRKRKEARGSSAGPARVISL